MENQPMLDQLRRVIFRWNLDPKRAIAVTTYGTVENIVALEDMGIWAMFPCPTLTSTLRTGAHHTSPTTRIMTNISVLRRRS
jgi:hypothetical protein